MRTKNFPLTLVAALVTGIAANAAEKSLVTKLVSDIRGVTGVDNQMTIATATTK